MTHREKREPDNKGHSVCVWGGVHYRLSHDDGQFWFNMLITCKSAGFRLDYKKNNKKQSCLWDVRKKCISPWCYHRQMWRETVMSLGSTIMWLLHTAASSLSLVFFECNVQFIIQLSASQLGSHLCTMNCHFDLQRSNYAQAHQRWEWLLLLLRITHLRWWPLRRENNSGSILSPSWWGRGTVPVDLKPSTQIRTNLIMRTN